MTSKKMLVGIDGSRQARKAFTHALDLSRCFGASLHAVAVIYGPDIEMAEPDEREQLINRYRQRFEHELEQLREQARGADLEVEFHVLEGHPVESLLEFSWHGNFDHIVVGHRRKGMFERLLMGSVARQVVDYARCSVTVVR
jgi:nucleotide-binding universal stress UspA family protein